MVRRICGAAGVGAHKARNAARAEGMHAEGAPVRGASRDLGVHGARWGACGRPLAHGAHDGLLAHGAGALLDRRAFLKLAAGAALLGAAAPSLVGCEALQGNMRTVIDMGGREVAVPETIERVFCSNPIGTVDMYLLDPDVLVGWNFRPTGDNRKYIPEKYLNLPPLGVWMGSGATPNDEEIVRQSPQAILCYWTADEVGCDMADGVRNETGVPTLLIDYDIRACAEMYRYVGPLLGRTERAEELAAYCDEKLAYIRACTEKIPASEKKGVYIAQGLGGLSTDPVGSMHVTDALELINTDNVVDLPGAQGQGMGMPTVNLEQIITWNPDAVLVSEYSMSNSESSDLYGEITADADWQNVPCVRKGQVFRLPQSPFAWFGRPPSVVRLLGCLLVLKLLYPDYTADIDLVEETRAFYALFFRMELEDDELREILETAGIDVSSLGAAGAGSESAGA